MFRIVTPPAFYPISLEEAKAHLNVLDHADDDALIQIYIKAATDHAENFAGVALVDQVIDYYLDKFPPNNGVILLPRVPLVSLTGVFTSEGGTETEVSNSIYASDASRVFLYYGQNWPTINAAPNSVRIRYRAGYAQDPQDDSPPFTDIPYAIKAAILLTIGTMYESREDVVVDKSVEQLPLTAQLLLRPYRIYTAVA